MLAGVRCFSCARRRSVPRARPAPPNAASGAARNSRRALAWFAGSTENPRCTNSLESKWSYPLLMAVFSVTDVF